MLSHFSHVRLFVTLRTIAHARVLCPCGSPGKNTRVGCHPLLQGIFPTQGSSPGLLHLLHCRQMLYQDYAYTAPSPVPADGTVDSLGVSRKRRIPLSLIKPGQLVYKRWPFCLGPSPPSDPGLRHDNSKEHPQQAHKTSTQISSKKKDFCWFKDLRDEGVPSVLHGNCADSSIESSSGRESSSSSQRSWKTKSPDAASQVGTELSGNGWRWENALTCWEEARAKSG